MTQTAPVTDVLTTRLGADYLEEPLAFFLSGSGDADDFTGCSISGGIYQDGALVVDLSTATGRTAIALPNVVNITVPAAIITSLGTGTFKVSLNLITAGGQTQDLVDYALRVISP